MDIRETIFFKDCMNKIWFLSKASLEAKSHTMSAEKKAIAKKRLSDELELICNNGYAYEYYINKIIVGHALSANKPVYVGGQAPYSYVAYLLGITTVDPLEREYPIEMVFGFHHDRTPGFYLHVSEDFKEELAAYLAGVFGSDKVTRKDNTIILGDKSEDMEHMSRNTLCLFVFSSKLMNTVQGELTKSGESFKEQRGSIFAPIYPSGVLDSTVDVKALPGLIVDANLDELDVMNYESLLDGTYEGLLRALAVTNGTGVLEADLRDDDGHLICTRDDFYRFGHVLLDSDKNAFKFMSKVRKGQARYDEYRDGFVNLGVPDDIIDKLKSIKYVVNEGSLIPAAQIILYLARDRQESE